MKIEVLQVENKGQNLFDIKYNGELKYKAKLPFVSIDDPLDLEKIRSFKITDVNENEIYKTNYNYIKNKVEEAIPMKYLFTGSQKFNQLEFVSDNNTIKIHLEATEFFLNRYVIDINDKRYFCYSVEDGYIRHFPIYDGDIQIGEALKSSVVLDLKDEYWCYLKEGYESLSDGVVALLLYLDRSEYSSSLLGYKVIDLKKNYSLSKANKFYDKNWVLNNFGDEFYKKIDNIVDMSKETFKHPIESIKSMPDQNKKFLKIILIFLAVIFILIITFLIILFYNF